MRRRSLCQASAGETLCEAGYVAAGWADRESHAPRCVDRCASGHKRRHPLRWIAATSRVVALDVEQQSLSQAATDADLVTLVERSSSVLVAAFWTPQLIEPCDARFKVYAG